MTDQGVWWLSTERPDGTDFCPLDALGTVGGVQVVETWPGGSSTVQASIDLPVDADLPQLTPGRILRGWVGPLCRWSGILDDPKRGYPWTLSGYGLSALGTRFVSVDSTPVASAVAQTVVDAAIARGLPWTRAVAFPTVTSPAGTPQTVTDCMNSWSNACGQRWAVNEQGVVYFAPDPTVPSVLIVNGDTPGGRSVDNYATRLYGTYLDATSGKPAIIHVADQGVFGSGPLGTFEDMADLTALGAMSAGNAATMLAGRLALVRPQATFTGTLTLVPGDVLSAGGVPVDLSVVRAGMLARLLGVAPDPMSGELDFATVVDIVIGSVTYTPASDSIQIAPVGVQQRNLSSLLTFAAASAPTSAVAF